MEEKPRPVAGAGPFGGHDGPYGVPLLAPELVVRPEWIDFNAHMNVGYYSVAFDLAVEHLWDGVLGLGESLAGGLNQGPYVVQSHIHYLAELLEGARFQVSLLLLDHDERRAHTILAMTDLGQGRLAATAEQVVVNVDLAVRKVTPYPAWGLRRLEALAAAHAGAPRPEQIGRPIGLRRRAP